MWKRKNKIFLERKGRVTTERGWIKSGAEGITSKRGLGVGYKGGGKGIVFTTKELETKMNTHHHGTSF